MFFLKVWSLKMSKTTPKQPPSRPRREGCGPSREGAVQPAAASRLGSDGSAAGAGGARSAGSPAAAPEIRKSPVPRLHCVARPLREVPGAAGHAAARPLRLCDGARRGGGGATPGGGQLLQGALCLAAAAVPRLAGRVPLRGGKAITCQINLNLCLGCNLCIRNISNQFKLCKSHSYLHLFVHAHTCHSVCCILLDGNFHTFVASCLTLCSVTSSPDMFSKKQIPLFFSPCHLEVNMIRQAFNL